MSEAKTVTLTSGKKLAITPAPFPDALALYKALLRAAVGMPLEENMLDVDVAAIKDALINAATSDDVERALFKCFGRCTYESAKVSQDLFDSPDLGEPAREDYYEIVVEVVKVNCGPFVKRIASLLKAASEKLRSAFPMSPSGPKKP